MNYRNVVKDSPPKNDEENQFQNNLAAKASADRSRPDRGAAEPRPAQPQQYQAPPPQYNQPYPYGYQQQPYPYYGYPIQPVAPVQTRAMQMDTMRGRRGRGI